MKTNFNFKDAKIGDKVYHVSIGWLDVTHNGEVGLEVNYMACYDHGGFAYKNDENPTIYPYNPFEQNKERVVEVSIDGKVWVKRVLIAVRSGIAVCWNDAETLEDSKEEIYTCYWKIWREVQEPTKTLTQEENINILWERFGEFGNDIC